MKDLLGHQAAEGSLILESGPKRDKAGSGIVFTLITRVNIGVRALWVRCGGLGGHEVKVFSCNRAWRDNMYQLSRVGDSAWKYLGRAILEAGGYGRIEFKANVMIGLGRPQTFYVHTEDASTNNEGVCFSSDGDTLTASDKYIDLLVGHRLMGELPFIGGQGIKASFNGKIEYDLGLSTPAANAGAVAIALRAATDAIVGACAAEDKVLPLLYKDRQQRLVDDFNIDVEKIGKDVEAQRIAEEEEIKTVAAEAEKQKGKKKKAKPKRGQKTNNEAEEEEAKREAELARRTQMGAFKEGCLMAIISAPDPIPRSANVRLKVEDKKKGVIVGKLIGAVAPLLEAEEKYNVKFKGQKAKKVKGDDMKYHGLRGYEFWHHAVRKVREEQGLRYALSARWTHGLEVCCTAVTTDKTIPTTPAPTLSAPFADDSLEQEQEQKEQEEQKQEEQKQEEHKEQEQEEHKEQEHEQQEEHYEWVCARLGERYLLSGRAPRKPPSSSSLPPACGHCGWFAVWADTVRRCHSDDQELRFAYHALPLEREDEREEGDEEGGRDGGMEGPRAVFECKAEGYEGKYDVGQAQKVELEWAQDKMGYEVKPVEPKDMVLTSLAELAYKDARRLSELMRKQSPVESLHSIEMAEREGCFWENSYYTGLDKVEGRAFDAVADAREEWDHNIKAVKQDCSRKVAELMEIFHEPRGLL